MALRFLFSILFYSAILQNIAAQSGSINGIVLIDGQPIEFAQIAIESMNLGKTSDDQGKFVIEKIGYGSYQITASYVGYKSIKKDITINETQPNVQLEFDLTVQNFDLDQIVVTGTKTFKRQTNSPVIVNILSSQTIADVQACNLSESLKFQPGLRVENDCQTCNYTQLRMNGLAGGYSQILINGRPIFSPLTGLYGMEQLPANMIDRIEVVRGGGSSLYGSSAIGGTVNVITKIPKTNSFELDYNYQNINGQTNDHILNGNATLVSENKNTGVSFFMNHRDRGFYDDNGDNFSEIPKIKNTSIGANLFFLPAENQKLELNISNINEYRIGGEMDLEKPAFLTKQSEERTHNVWMASADYQINFNEDKSALITYLAWQNTDRKHYTGVQPDLDTDKYTAFLANPPYGNSQISTFNIGTQLNHQVDNFIFGKNVFTFGSEYLFDSVLDAIPAYEFLVDQTTTDLGLFLQSDWEILPQLTLLSGLRMDKHNLVDQLILSPRASLLYKLKANTQFRLSYGTGFRAPQAFDTDLHIAFAGGGVSRIALAPELTHEKSQSWSGSINYDKPMDNWVAGGTIEGFYNRLNDAFFLQPIGQDQFGELFEKNNGSGATVKGLTFEIRANYNRKIQLESGITIQSSLFDNPVQYIDELEGIREFIRTPNTYGYSILTFTPSKKWKTVFNYLNTGSMLVPHFSGAPNQTINEIISSNNFSELSTKVSYTIESEKLGANIELYGGIKNIFNAYQDDFDLGKNRDSNFVYGPAQPRTIYVGLSLRSK